MSNEEQTMSNDILAKNVIDITVKLGILLLLYVWCFNIIKPFITPVIWAVIIAVTMYPLHLKMVDKLGGRKALAGTAFSIIALILLITPVYMFSGSLVEGVQSISTALEEDTLKVLAPSEEIKEWPLIGEKLYSAWHLASTNIDGAMVKYKSQIKSVAGSVLSAFVGGGLGVLQFILSIIIAGVLLVNAEGGIKSSQAFATRLSPKKGLEFVKLASATIRSVAQGVVGIGIVQGTFVGLGFWAVGVPGAGLWALLVMILSIAQLPPFLIIIPVIAYVFNAGETSTLVTIIFTIWSVFGGILDGLLKPFVMGRGVDSPMLVVMLGAIGGMILSGMLGLFIGAIVLSMGYILYMTWLDTSVE